MSRIVELFPATWRAIGAIDERCQNSKSGHVCVGSGAGECWWRRADLVELASVFERAMNVSGVNTLLLKFEELRAKVTANWPSSGNKMGAERDTTVVPTPAHLLQEARRLLIEISGPRPGVLCEEAAKPCFILRPVQLPREAHSPCKKCSDYYASMVKEDAQGSSYLCYLHAIDVVVGKEA